MVAVVPALMAGQFGARHHKPSTRLAQHQREFEVRVAVVARLGIRTADGHRCVLAYRHQVAEQDIDLPWPGAVDGKWTPELTEALQTFQEDLGVKPTGAVDADTLSALEEAIAEATSPQPTETPSSTPPTPTSSST